MRMAWLSVCLLAGPAALGQSAAVPEEVQVISQNGGVFVAPQFSTQPPGQQSASPTGQRRIQPPQLFNFAKPTQTPPVAKEIPIPTQWPNAKMEQIPTRWPQLKVVPLSAQAQPGAVTLPPRK